MKKIKIDGKLNLNKTSISKLNDPQMEGIKGGAETGLRCNTVNTLSYGEWCTKIDGCKIDEIYTKGIFCVKD